MVHLRERHIQQLCLRYPQSVCSSDCPSSGEERRKKLSIQTSFQSGIALMLIWKFAETRVAAARREPIRPQTAPNAITRHTTRQLFACVANLWVLVKNVPGHTTLAWSVRLALGWLSTGSSRGFAMCWVWGKSQNGGRALLWNVTSAWRSKHWPIPGQVHINVKWSGLGVCVGVAGINLNTNNNYQMNGNYRNRGALHACDCTLKYVIFFATKNTFYFFLSNVVRLQLCKRCMQNMSNYKCYVWNKQCI